MTNTGIKTCQVEYFENSHKPQKWYFRVGEMLVFENMNQNKGLTALKTTSKHVRSNEISLGILKNLKNGSFV